ncbi:MAG: hydrogenase maturation protease [Bacteroidales bacterium]|nr:hydrogenase maturation protease [Bacteroidales bacterium]
MPDPRRILIYAYGNPGRQDDGLGNRLVEEMEEWIREKRITNVALESNYQLNIEDAYNISEKDLVIFVDASVEDIDGIHFSPVEPSEGRSEFTTHSASPAFVLALCHKIYNNHPETYLLQIRGYEWEFKEVLSDRARRNLHKATAFLKDYIAKYQST